MACWTLSFLPGLATPPGISPMRWRPLPHAAGCRRQGGVHGAILGLVPPRLLSAREEGCLMQRPHRPGWSSGLVISATRSKLGPPFFGRRPQYAYLMAVCLHVRSITSGGERSSDGIAPSSAITVHPPPATKDRCTKVSNSDDWPSGLPENFSGTKLGGGNGEPGAFGSPDMSIGLVISNCPQSSVLP